MGDRRVPGYWRCRVLTHPWLRKDFGRPGLKMTVRAPRLDGDEVRRSESYAMRAAPQRPVQMHLMDPALVNEFAALLSSISTVADGTGDRQAGLAETRRALTPDRRERRAGADELS
jgi:hypothetical protein